MTVIVIPEDTIDAYLTASQRPFNNRLEVVCYLWINANFPHSQEKEQAAAKDLAQTILAHLDVEDV